MRMDLPQCRHRGPEIVTGRWHCHSAKLVIPARVVAEDICRSCPYQDHAVESVTATPPVPIEGIHPRMPLDDFIRRLDQPTNDFPLHWQFWEIAQLAHRELLDRALARPVAYPDQFQGRGIVIGAGGPVYFPCAYICVRILRHLGCDLPVEFWHLGPAEVSDAMRELVQPLGVTWRDAAAIAPRPRILNGWELKPFAILHSRFREVLYLDADNMAAVDPTYLFTDERFRSTGALFWPDLTGSLNGKISELTWDVAGIDWRTPPAFESGQILIDKSQCWRELQLTMHLNEHSDFWFRYVYGDKDTFKLAWHKSGRAYAMPAREADWTWPAIFQYDLDGQLVFTHACQGKSKLRKGEPIASLPRSALAVYAAQELHRAYPKPKIVKETRHIDTTALPGSGPFFNAAVFARQRQLFLAYRAGEHASRIGIARLDERTLQPATATLITLDHPFCADGQEDPRVFVHAGRTFLQFNGIRKQDGRTRIRVMLAELDQDLGVSAIHVPRYAESGYVEKNWQFFSWGEELCAIYTISPNVVFAFDNEFRVKQIWKTDRLLNWSGGLPRGGASPCLRDDEHYCFFHGVKPAGDHLIYSTGIYTFAAQPPFTIRRVMRNPVLEPDPLGGIAADRKLIVYPCGAIFHEGNWLVSYGVHDRGIELAVVDHAALLQQLENVP
jgi:predicted GH43/DUF377 family glycosyl hydrolase